MYVKRQFSFKKILVFEFSYQKESRHYSCITSNKKKRKPKRPRTRAAWTRSNDFPID